MGGELNQSDYVIDGENALAFGVRACAGGEPTGGTNMRFAKFVCGLGLAALIGVGCKTGGAGCNCGPHGHASAASTTAMPNTMIAGKTSTAAHPNDTMRAASNYRYQPGMAPAGVGNTNPVSEAAVNYQPIMPPANTAPATAGGWQQMSPGNYTR
jgi:hypothetical protein